MDDPHSPAYRIEKVLSIYSLIKSLPPVLFWRG